MATTTSVPVQAKAAGYLLDGTGHVRVRYCDEAAGVFIGRVQGTADEPYVVTCSGGHWACTCPASRMCAHVTACMQVFEPAQNPAAEPEHIHAPLPFGRRVPGCPRCEALAAGTVQPRSGFSARTRSDDRQRAAEIRDHFWSERHRAECHPVCTFGDW